MGHILARESFSIPRPEIATLFILGLVMRLAQS